MTDRHRSIPCPLCRDAPMRTNVYGRHMRTHVRQLLATHNQAQLMRESRSVCVCHHVIKSVPEKRMHEFTFAICLGCGMDMTCLGDRRSNASNKTRHEYLTEVSAAHRFCEEPTAIEEFMAKHNKSCGNTFDKLTAWFDMSKKPPKLPARPKTTTDAAKPERAPRKTLVPKTDPQGPPLGSSTAAPSDRELRDGIAKRFPDTFDWYGWETEDDDEFETDDEAEEDEERERREEWEDEMNTKREDRAEQRGLSVLEMLDRVEKSMKFQTKYAHDASARTKRIVSDIEMKHAKERAEMENRMHHMEREMEAMKRREERVLGMQKLLEARMQESPVVEAEVQTE
jgi:hypothetical protein